MDYTATIEISKERSAFLKKALAEPGHMDDEEVHTESVSFLDGMYIVDVKCVGCGDEEPAWTEAVLFKRNVDGLYSEVSHTDVEDEFLGDWDLVDFDGNSYTVTVKEAE